jgi:hypothetical protein
MMMMMMMMTAIRLGSHYRTRGPSPPSHIVKLSCVALAETKAEIERASTISKAIIIIKPPIAVPPLFPLQ